MKRINNIELLAFRELPYKGINPSGDIITESLFFYNAYVSSLPRDGVVFATADLQGISKNIDLEKGEHRLLGETVAEELYMLWEQGRIPSPEKFFVLLGGDYYARPLLDCRGGSGDVLKVLYDFAERFPPHCGNFQKS